MKEQIKTIKKDIDIIIQAISNNDNKDAISMLKEIQQELEILELISS